MGPADLFLPLTTFASGWFFLDSIIPPIVNGYLGRCTSASPHRPRNYFAEEWEESR